MCLSGFVNDDGEDNELADGKVMVLVVVLSLERVLAMVMVMATIWVLVIRMVMLIV